MDSSAVSSGSSAQQKWTQDETAILEELFSLYDHFLSLATMIIDHPHFCNRLLTVFIFRWMSALYLCLCRYNRDVEQVCEAFAPWRTVDEVRFWRRYWNSFGECQLANNGSLSDCTAGKDPVEIAYSCKARQSAFEKERFPPLLCR